MPKQRVAYPDPTSSLDVVPDHNRRLTFFNESVGQKPREVESNLFVMVGSVL